MNFIQKHRRPLSALLVAAVIVAAATLVPQTVRADAGEVLASWLAQLGYYLIQFFANLLVVVINIMVAVAQYNDFLAAPAVTKGWVIVRDVSNMFFIVVLLIIAFGTILKLENYRYNRLLARLIVMAILVNFSKFIAGFFIDFSQVVMLTFVNAWRDVAAGNITTSLGLKQIVSIAQSGDSISVEANEGAVLTAVMLGLFLVAVATIVMSIIAIVLILRILALWFLIVLSPLAYLLRTYPSTEKYAARWWSEFGKYVVTGPVVAFLLWLTLAIMAQSGNNLSDQVLKTEINRETGESGQVIRDIGSNSGTASRISAAITEIGQSERLLSYITGIMLLVGTLVITKELGVAGGQLAGQWADKIKGFGTKAAIVGGAGAAFGAVGIGAVLGGKRAVQLATSGVKAGAGFGARKLDELSIRAQRGKGPLAGLYRRTGLDKTALGRYLADKPISLRPSMVKKAYEAYRHGREEAVYGPVQGGLRDTFNLVASRGKKVTNFARQAEDREIKARVSEIRSGSTKQEVLVPELMKRLEVERDDNGRATSAKIHDGEESYVQALMEILTSNHDFNEVMKNRDIASILRNLRPAGETAPVDVTTKHAVRMLKHLFGHESVDVAQDLGEIGLANTDAWMYGMTKINSKGESEFIDEETIAARSGKNYQTDLTNYNPAQHRGVSWGEYVDQLVEDAQKAGDGKVGDERDQAIEAATNAVDRELGQYREYYDDQAEITRAGTVAAFFAKKENRQQATKQSRQDSYREIMYGRNRMYFGRDIHPVGQGMHRDTLSTGTDNRYAKPEVKSSHQQHLDTLLAVADMGADNPEVRKAAKQRWLKITGGRRLPLVSMNPENRMAMFREVMLEMGIDIKNFEELSKSIGKKDGFNDQDEVGEMLRMVVSDFQQDGRYPKYELRFGQLVEENRHTADNQGFDDDITEEATDALESKIKLQAAKDAGYKSSEGIPKLGPPAGVTIPKAEEFRARKAGRPRVAPTATSQESVPTTSEVEEESDEPEEGSAGAPLMDVAAARYQATRTKADEYEARLGAGSFFRSPEYRANPDQYIDEETFSQAKELENVPVAPLGGIRSFGSGDSNTLGFDARSFAGGKYGDRAGHYLEDPKDVKAFLSEYDTILQDEYTKLAQKADKTDGEKLRMLYLENARHRIAVALANPEDVTSLVTARNASLQSRYELLDAKPKDDRTKGENILMQELEKAQRQDKGVDDLKVVNLARVGYSGRHVAAHEDTHGKLDAMDADRSFRRSMLRGMAPDDRQQLVQAIRDKMGNQQMTEEEAFDEYLTEGIVNSWKSWADASPDAVQLDPALMDAIQQQADKSGQKRFMTSKDIPELEDYAKSPGQLQENMGALGYKTAGKAQDLARWTGQKAGSAARGMGAFAAVSARWTGKQMARGVSSVFGSTIGQAINKRLAQAAETTVKVGKTVGGAALVGGAVVAGGAAIGGQAIAKGAQAVAGGVQKGVAVTGAVAAIGAQRTRDALQNFQISQEKKRRDKVLKIEQDTQKQMEAVRVKRAQRIQQEKSTNVSRANWNKQDEGFAQQVTDLNKQRDQAVRAGNIGSVTQFSQQITQVERQRNLARQRQQEGNQYLEQARREEAAAKSAAEKLVAKADAERAKVFGPKLQTPQQLREGLNEQDFNGLDQRVQQKTKWEAEYQTATADATQKREAYLTPSTDVSEQGYDRLKQEMDGAAARAERAGKNFDEAQKNLEEFTKRLISEAPVGRERRGPTPGAPLASQERRTVTEEVKEVRTEVPSTRTETVVEKREAAPTERTERVIEEREAPATERTETVVEQRAEQEESHRDSVIADSATSGDMNALANAFEESIDRLADQLNAKSAAGFGRLEQALKALEKAGGSTENFRNVMDRMQHAEGGKLIETDFEKSRTVEYLKDLVHSIRELNKHSNESKTPNPPQRGPGGEPL